MFIKIIKNIVVYRIDSIPFPCDSEMSGFPDGLSRLNFSNAWVWIIRDLLDMRRRSNSIWTPSESPPRAWNAFGKNIFSMFTFNYYINNVVNRWLLLVNFKWLTWEFNNSIWSFRRSSSTWAKFRVNKISAKILFFLN